MVEDNAEDAELVLRALEKCGFGDRVAHVTDGDEALDYVAGTGVFARSGLATAPKLILLDLGLKKLSGAHVLRKLKLDARTKGIPVVALTGSTVAIQLAESYKLGVNSYVIKPTSSDEFNKLVAKIGQYWLEINQPPPP